MKILLLAGEESGLIYARAIRERLGGHDVRGYADYGFQTADLAVVGILAVLFRIGFFLRVARTMKRAIDDWRPDVVVTVDYPGMNLKLAAYAKARGIRAVHVVCPQVWAWKRGRIPKIERSLDALCCFFPFEPKLFRTGFATFVGHPLVGDFEKTRKALAMEGRTRDARQETGDSGRETRDERCSGRETRDSGRETMTIALLPGSRRGEIARNLPPLLEAARILLKSRPGLRFAIPAVHAAAEKQIRSIVDTGKGSDPMPETGAFTGKGSDPMPETPVEVRLGGAREVLLSASCAAVASGTATLEAALARCPTVLVYRVSAATAWIARRVIKGTRFLGLANILWDKCGGTDSEQPMPELLQEDFTPEAVAERLNRWLDDPSARAAAIRRLDSATSLLVTGDDPSARIVETICRKGEAK